MASGRSQGDFALTEIRSYAEYEGLPVRQKKTTESVVAADSKNSIEIPSIRPRKGVHQP